MSVFLILPRVSRARRPRNTSLVQAAQSSLQDARERLRQLDLIERTLNQEGLAKGEFHSLEGLGIAALDGTKKTHDQVQEELGDKALVVEDIDLDLGLAPPPSLRERRRQVTEEMRSFLEETGVAAAHKEGITGEDVLVGVLDTGVDADHAEFKNKHIPFLYTPLSRAKANRRVRGFDPSGHGTHVCGRIVGERLGVAPGASLAVASVIESEAVRTSLLRIASALDWFIGLRREDDYAGGPAILNLSLGFRPEHLNDQRAQNALEIVEHFIGIAVEHDITVVAAIGNNGPGTVCLPGSLPTCIGVGAVNRELTPWESSGGSIKKPLGPDLVGLGVAEWSAMERLANNRSLYAPMSGTSMAAPYTSGIAALVAQKYALQGEALSKRLVADALALDHPKSRVGAGLARIK